MLHRTQVLLEDWQYHALRSLSERRGRSVSSLLREWIRERLEETGGGGDLEEIAGIGRRSQPERRHHDQVLYGKNRRKRKRER